jgi:hypothetical protein
MTPLQFQGTGFTIGTTLSHAPTIAYCITAVHFKAAATSLLIPLRRKYDRTTIAHRSHAFCLFHIFTIMEKKMNNEMTEIKRSSLMLEEQEDLNFYDLYHVDLTCYFENWDGKFKWSYEYRDSNLNLEKIIELVRNPPEGAKTNTISIGKSLYGMKYYWNSVYDFYKDMKELKENIKRLDYHKEQNDYPRTTR